MEETKIQSLGAEVIQTIGEHTVPMRKKRLWGQRSKLDVEVKVKVEKGYGRRAAGRWLVFSDGGEIEALELPSMTKD